MLYQGVQDVEWREHVARAGTLSVDANGIGDTLRHTEFVAQKVKDAIVDQIRAAFCASASRRTSPYSAPAQKY